MSRPAVPKKTKEAVLREYSSLCAICGSHGPQIHHIDETPGNNSEDNLLPLCPNCHLRDQHNPTKSIEVGKLRLFRKYKDPAILKPQFHPIYGRQRFLEAIDESTEPITLLAEQVNELIELIENLEMGRFYGKRIYELTLPPRDPAITAFLAGDDPKYLQRVKDESLVYRRLLRERAEAIQSLLIEQLRFQRWAHEV